MPGDNRKTPRIPESYDEIVRRTVPDLDSSWRPTKQQETQAAEGFRQMSPDEEALHARVAAALAGSGLPVDDVAIEIERASVTVRGTVADVSLLGQIERVIHAVDGVEDVRDDLVVKQGS